MSNVLIGIIGVILFIGLALAGALFLGPRFQESTNNSRASAAVQAVSQVSNAANMYKVQEGTDASAGDVADGGQLVTSGYLKSTPSNPAGTAAINLGATGTSRFVTMVLAGNAKAICQAINKQSGVAMTGTNSDVPPTTASGTQGCFSADGSTAFTAYSRV